MRNKDVTKVSLMTLVIATILIFMSTGVAMAAVWTDQLDYSPGSVVTISGDNSDNAGYVAGEMVNVSVNGPYLYDSKCSTIADVNGAWSCTVTLASDLSAVGTYYYTAVGQTSGITQSGTFTDAPISTTLSKPTISATSISLGNSVNIAGTLSVGGSGTLNGHTIRLQVSFNGGAFASTGLTTTTDSSGSYSFSYTPASGGTYVFRTQINPSDTGNTGYAQESSSSSDSLTVISNVPPTISTGNPSVFINEGLIATNTGTYSDSNSGDNVGITASVGAISKTGTNSGTWSWTYATTDGPAQSQTVTITANDGNGGTSVTTFPLTVNNVLPIATFNVPSSADEGNPISLSLSGPSDPSSVDTSTGFKYAFDCGDGSGYGVLSSSNTASCPTSDDGTRSVKGKIQDKDGGFNEYTASVAINNVAPTIVLSGAANVNEGSLYTLGLGAMTDPGSDTVSSYTINWGDGSSNPFSGSPVGQSKTHTYADGPNSYTIKVDLTDEDGTFASAGSQSVIVDNVVPTLTISGAANVDEGSIYTLSLSSTDPGTDTITSWNINWGDGNTETISSNPSSAIHTYADGPNSYTISATATDEDGTFDANTVGVQVNNVQPTISSVTNNGPIDEGSGATITVSASDPAGVNDPLKYEFDCNNDGSYEIGPQSGNSATCSFGDNGNFNVKVKVSDGDGGEATDVTTVVVNNIVPIVDAGSDAIINEGSTFSQSGSFTDPGTDTWGATVDYGWSGEQPLTLVGKTFSLSHLYVDNDDYPVTVKVTDDDGGIGIDTLNVKVNNVAPSIIAPSDQSATQGISELFSLGSFNDPGINDNPWVVDVDWGDSSVHTTFNMLIQGTITTQSHAYSSIGTYTVTVKVTDKDGGFDSKTFSIDVNYNFAGFFQPVDNNGVWNVVKAGSAIPLKFSLSGNQGLDIISPGYPISKKVTYNGGGLDDVETTLTAGSSSLTYDPIADQYIYVWKTDKAWTGTYRQLVVILKDGTEHMANFKFK